MSIACSLRQAPSGIFTQWHTHVQGHGDARPGWKTVASLTWAKMLHFWRPLCRHDHLLTLPARSMQTSPALTPQNSRKAAAGPFSPRSDASMSAVPLKSDWQLRALHAEPGSGRSSLDGAIFMHDILPAAVQGAVGRHTWN